MTATMIAKGRKMAAKYSGVCTECEGKFPAGTEIFWGRRSGVQHVTCVEWRVANDRAEDIADIAVAVDPNCGKAGGCQDHDGECAPFGFNPCWAGGRCLDAPACGCGS